MFHVKFKTMKIQFFDIEDLKIMPLRVWSNQLTHTSERMFGNIYFVANGRKFRVGFDCMPNFFYEANFYYYGYRCSFNKKCSESFESLLGKVYALLTE